MQNLMRWTKIREDPFFLTNLVIIVYKRVQILKMMQMILTQKMIKKVWANNIKCLINTKNQIIKRNMSSNLKKQMTDLSLETLKLKIQTGISFDKIYLVRILQKKRKKEKSNSVYSILMETDICLQQKQTKDLRTWENR